MIATISSVFQAAFAAGIPLLYGSTGEIITQKSGNMNLGIPGIMYVGGISGTIGAFLYEHNAGASFNPFLAVTIPFLCAIVGSLLVSLLYCFLVVTLRVNQNVTGLAITTFGVGIGNFFGNSLVGLTGGEAASVAFPKTTALFRTSLPFADDLGEIGKMFFSYSAMVYLAIVIAIVSSIIISKTRVGLHLRAVGESPATADAAGINVTAYKYGATCIGGVIAGLGGLYYVVDYIGTWSNNGFGDRGWLAIALVIFALWKPWLAILGSFLFGGLSILFMRIPGLDSSMQEIFKMAPYLVTVLVLILISVRRKRENQPPESLGLPYFREER